MFKVNEIEFCHREMGSTQVLFYKNVSGKIRLLFLYPNHRMIKLLLGIFATFTVASSHIYEGYSPNSCIQFSVSSGTGCAWMCDYCANKLGTNNYYFPDSVCTYQTGGCVGNPIAGKTYTCCSV